jgi:hypothetical protein
MGVIVGPRALEIPFMALAPWVERFEKWVTWADVPVPA